jgi:predicted nucleic acid-binding Zn ribbon protein
MEYKNAAIENRCAICGRAIEPEEEFCSECAKSAEPCPVCGKIICECEAGGE